MSNGKDLGRLQDPSLWKWKGKLKDDHGKLPGQCQTTTGVAAGGRCGARKLGQDYDDDEVPRISSRFRIQGYYL